MDARQLDQRDKALAVLHAPTDNARAVWHGLVLVGHRRSVEAGEMVWALPGRQWAYQATLARDKDFTVLAAPSTEYLLTQRQALKELPQ